MTKQLTQDVFKDYPKWVKSAAVHGRTGKVTLYGVTKDKLFAMSSVKKWSWIESRNFEKYLTIDGDYDTTNWQNSAIDRE